MSLGEKKRESAAIITCRLTAGEIFTPVERALGSDETVRVGVEATVVGRTPHVVFVARWEDGVCADCEEEEGEDLHGGIAARLIWYT